MDPQANSGMPGQDNGQPEPLQQFGAQTVITPGVASEQPEYFPPAFVDPSTQVPTVAPEPVQPIAPEQPQYVGPAFMQEPTTPQPQAEVPAPEQPQYVGPAFMQESTPVVSAEVPTNTVPAFAAAAPVGEFTSNPFIAFGKGFGASLFRSPGATMGLGVVLILSLLGLTILNLVASIALAGISPLVVLLLFLFVVVVAAIVFASFTLRTIVVLTKSIEGETVSLKQSKNTVNRIVVYKLLAQQILIGIAIFIGLLLFVIPGLILIARLSLSPFILVNENLGIFQSIKRSWNLTKSNFWNMLGAITVQNIAGGSSLLLLPALYGGAANRYTELTLLEKSGTTNSGKTHWLNFFVPIVVLVLCAVYIGIIIASTIASSNLRQNSSVPSSTTINSTSSETGKYCYFDINAVTNETSGFACTDDTAECQANAACKEANADLLQ